MGIRFALCPHRLLFRQPFGTAHGTRDGTDALFVRLDAGGHYGYGEVTLPPYLKETIPQAMQAIGSLASEASWDNDSLEQCLGLRTARHSMPSGARAAVHMALMDMISKDHHVPVVQLLDIHDSNSPLSLVTLGISSPSDVAAKLADLPQSGALKLKAGDAEAVARFRRVRELDARPVLIDGNQGLGSLQDALDLVEALGTERVVGIEQPFAEEFDGLNAELAARTGLTVIADESIQSLEELEQRGRAFGGVNLKLMKCGGLDVAARMAKKARAMGLRVMLGSMSESSLGCTAMARLAGLADLADLDGPWLLKNDPFEGLGMKGAELRIPAGTGIGAVLKAELQFDPVCV